MKNKVYVCLDLLWVGVETGVLTHLAGGKISRRSRPRASGSTTSATPTPRRRSRHRRIERFHGQEFSARLPTALYICNRYQANVPVANIHITALSRARPHTDKRINLLLTRSQMRYRSILIGQALERPNAKTKCLINLPPHSTSILTPTSSKPHQLTTICLPSPVFLFSRLQPVTLPTPTVIDIHIHGR